MAATNSQILDHLAHCCAEILRGPDERARLVAVDYFHRHDLLLRGEFDYFLVRMDDELAYQAGSPESRWIERVTRMAHLARTGELPPTKTESLEGKRCALCVCDSTGEKFGFPVCDYHQEHGEDEPGCECGRDR